MQIVWILVLIVAQKSETVYWTARTPLQFYDNALLECKIHTNDVGTTKWTGGYMNEILTYNEGSLYKNKYSAEFNLDKNVYYLNITNFSEQDVNVVYTCFCGFDKYSRNLTIDENKFECKYIIKTSFLKATTNRTNGVLKLNVTLMKVWPGPQCSLTVNNKSATGVMKNHTSKGGMFLQSIFTYSQDIDDSEVSVTMSCNIGTKRYNVFAEHLNDSNLEIGYGSRPSITMSTDSNSCNGTDLLISMNSESSTSITMPIIIIIVISIFAIVAVLILVTVFVSRRREKKGKLFQLLLLIPSILGYLKVTPGSAST